MVASVRRVVGRRRGWTTVTDASDEQRRDRDAIIEVLRRYAAGIDGRDREAVRELFTPDAILDYRTTDGPRGPRDEVVDWLLDALAGVTLTQHLLTNHDVEVDGDTARATTLMFNPLVMATDDGGASILFFGGRYEDEFVRADDGWRIRARVHVVDWETGPMPGRLRSR